MGGPISAWYPYFERWRGRYRVISWDYRGLYGSVLPAQATDLSVQAHSQDLRSILQAAGVKSATILGWSMGVQVGLEFYRNNPKTAARLVLVNGTYGKPLGGISLPFSGLSLPPLVRVAEKLHKVGSFGLKRLSRSSLSFPFLQKLRIIAPGLERERYQEMLDDIASIDLSTYFKLLSHLHEHDAEEGLKDVLAPTLVLTGSRDVLTPPWLARKIASEIPKAELFVLSGGTHYAAAEYPSLIAQRVETFLLSEAVD